MNGKNLNKLFNINAKHALYREDGKWYHNLTNFPGVLFDEDGYIIFENEKDYNLNPQLQIKKDLHVINGIKSLKDYIKFSFDQKKLLADFKSKNSQQIDSEDTIRITREIELILRKRSLVNHLKKLYKSTCQICEIQLSIGYNKFYSEVHHLKPLGRPHNGSDDLGNMICVCPNCHVLLDLKVVKLESKSFGLMKHNVSIDNINYHNSLVRE